MKRWKKEISGTRSSHFCIWSMSKKSYGPAKKMAPSAPSPHSEPESSAGPDAAMNAAAGAAAGAVAGVGLWGFAMPAANFIGFTTTGIASGSTAASMMSAAAIANGGGVASGSAVAVLQSVGAVGLATPIGLALVAGGAAVGGAAFLMKSRLSSRQREQTDTAVSEVEDEEKSVWVLVEIPPDSGKPVISTFDDDYKARNAFLNSRATRKALFDPEKKIVLEFGWDHSMYE
ncbi:hypothetical protein F442_03237 [Phytophthora nicotianae P10297]|uniref:Uncharacterized protein n=1 Tax=Phytophthora nicotianae P10297 TaxID=1317064 RepID=W2ZZF8_PHYNI|nr:hypothetical protein F442_03237 [Phytophthora nicotianae P10297]